MDRVSAVKGEERDWGSEEADDFGALIDIVEGSALRCVVSRLPSFQPLFFFIHA